MTRREIIKQGGLVLTALAFPFPITAFTKFNHMTDNKNFDVIIIGGSYAGLSSAMALGRSLRNVLIIDGGQPCNKQTPHSHNFLTQDGKTPKKISTIAKQQVEKYETIKFYEGLAISGTKTEHGFEVTTNENHKITAKKLIFATGIKDTMPDIKGFSECWGISVIHCPYCHGYEFRNQKTAIISNGEKAIHLAPLVNNLSDNLTILTLGEAEFNAEELVKLKRNKIQIIENEISEFEHENGQVKNVIFKDGSKTSFNAVYASVPFKQHSEIPIDLGCELTEQGYIKVDGFQKTTVSGVFACGDNSGMRSIANAVYTGNIAGAMTNKELADEQF